LNFLVIDPPQRRGGAGNYFSSCPVNCVLEYLFGLMLQSRVVETLGSASCTERRVVETSGSASCSCTSGGLLIIDIGIWNLLACCLYSLTGTMVPATT